MIGHTNTQTGRQTDTLYSINTIYCTLSPEFKENYIVNKPSICLQKLQITNYKHTGHRQADKQIHYTA